MFGQTLVQELKSVIQYSVKLAVNTGEEQPTASMVHCDIQRSSLSRENNAPISTLLLVGFRDGKLLLWRRVHSRFESQKFTIHVPKTDQEQEVSAHVPDRAILSGGTTIGMC